LNSTPLTRPSPIKPPRTRPGRPSKAASAEIDARILDAAFAAFVDQGFDALSMEAIAEKAGVTRATLYQRHDHKLALFRAVITGRNDTWQRISDSTDWMAGDTLEQRLCHFAQTVISWSLHPEIAAARSLSNSVRGHAGGVAHELEMTFRQKMAKMLGDDIADYAAREAMAVRDSQQAALFLTGMLEAVTRKGLARGDSVAVMQQHGCEAVAVLLRGIAG
jgi:AcrR family transcriptional regulator